MKPSLSIEKNIVFGKTDKEFLTADLYKPKNNEETHPVIVMIHGGAYQTGSKEMYLEWGQALADEGYFVMAINYRLAYPGYATYPGALDDVGLALDWLVVNANSKNIDINRIGLVGDSAGAHLAALYALRYRRFSHKISAVVGVYGIYDIVEECKSPVSDRLESMYRIFFGHSIKGHEDLYRTASPSHYVPQTTDSATFDTSFYLVSGTQDKIINPNQTKLFYKRLKESGVVVFSKEIDDRGHFWFNLLPGIKGGGVRDYPNSELYPELIQFLRRHVKESIGMNFSKRRLKILADMESLSAMPGMGG